MLRLLLKFVCVFVRVRSRA